MTHQGSMKISRTMKNGPREAKFTPPSYVLKAKSPPTGQRLDAVLAAADIAVAERAGDYLRRARESVAKLERAFDAMHCSGDGRTSQVVLFAIAHDMRGEGGTYGFPLVTDIAGSLCTLLEGSEEADRPPHEAIAVHITALKLVMANSIEGDGGAQGAELLRGLEKVRAAEGIIPS